MADENINIVQQTKISLEQNVDMLAFNAQLGRKLLLFVARWADSKSARILIELLDVFKGYDEGAYNKTLLQLDGEAQGRVRDLQLANLKIGKHKSCVIDMDKEMRPMSRGRSSCGNRSMNSTMTRTQLGAFDNGPSHEPNILRLGDDTADDNDSGEG